MSRSFHLPCSVCLCVSCVESPHIRALSLGRQRQRTRKLPCRVRDSKWRPMSTLVISTALDRSDSTLEACCHLGIATEHAIYACSFATALCRLCCRASYKRREACEQIFPSSLFGKADMRLRLRLLCVSERHCYRAWLQLCSNLSIRHAPRGRCMKKKRIMKMIMIMLRFPSVLT